MTVAFFGHRHWSFAHRARTGFKREYPMFLAINGLTLLLGLAIVAFARYGLDRPVASGHQRLDHHPDLARLPGLRPAARLRLAG